MRERTEMDDKLKRLPRQLGRLADEIKSWRKLRAREGESPFVLREAAEKLRKLLDSEKLRSDLEVLRTDLNESEENLTKEISEFQAHFGGHLEVELERAGIPVSGRWPSWTAGPFRLTARPAAGAMALEWGPGVEKVATCPLDVEAALQARQEASDALQEGHLGEGLLPILFKSWRMAAVNMELPRNAPVPLVGLLPFVAVFVQGDHFLAKPGRSTWRRSYDRVQFSYDLALLRGASYEGRPLRLRVATRDQTKKGDALWLPDDRHGRGTLFSTLQFDRSE